MVNQQQIQGNWNEIRGKLKQKWGKLTDDDVRSFNGNIDQLVGRIQTKTGETREAVENYLAELTEEGSQMLENVRKGVDDAAGRVADTARQGYDAMRDRYAEAEEIVQNRPGQAVAVAFGLGLVAGLGLALCLRGRQEHHFGAHSRRVADHVGHHLRDTLASMMPESLRR